MSWNFANKFRHWELKNFSAFQDRINIHDSNEDKTANVIILWRLKNPSVKIKTDVIVQI